MTSRELRKLRKKLPPNGEGINQIAELTNYSKVYVRKVLNNERANDLIVNEAIKIATDYQNQLKKNIKLIQSL